MSSAETSAYLLIASGMVWVLVGILGLMLPGPGRGGSGAEQTVRGNVPIDEEINLTADEAYSGANGPRDLAAEDAASSEQCLAELIDLLNSDHPLMKPHVDSIVEPHLAYIAGDTAENRKQLAQAFFDRTEPSQRRSRIHKWINP